MRVVSGRYERTLARKAYEQVLAICVSRRRRKAKIANAYLTIACYGSNMVGIDGLRAKLGNPLSTCDMGGIREMIARLKYPEPSRPTAAWERRVQARVTYIERREAQLRRNRCGRFQGVVAGAYRRSRGFGVTVGRRFRRITGHAPGPRHEDNLRVAHGRHRRLSLHETPSASVCPRPRPHMRERFLSWWITPISCASPTARYAWNTTGTSWDCLPGRFG